MKKWLSVLLVALMLLGLLAGCGGPAATPAGPTDSTPTEQTNDPDHRTTPPENIEGNLLFTFFGNLEVDASANWGDCTLVTLPDGSRVLVDACEGGYETHIVRQLQEAGVTKIHSAIISHYHSDHYGGLMTFVEKFGIEQVYINAIELDDSLEWNTNAAGLQGYIRKLENAGVKVTSVLAGDTLQFGDVRVDFLYPKADTASATTNDTSLVFTFNWKGQSALFPGDIYYAGEDACMAEVDQALLKADVLKIMHHGANTSGGSAFIQAVSPKVAVAMGNHVMTDIGVYRYTKVGAQVYQSWRDGDVNVLLDGTDVTVWTQQ